MTDVDALYGRTREGDVEAFTSWVRLCETPLRRSLRKFAAVADVEGVLQEGLLRMWVLAPTLELTGDNASLRYAHRMVRNLAISEARRTGRRQPIDEHDSPAADLAPDRPLDEAFRRAVRRCLQKLPRRPREAIEARLRGGDDRRAAAGLRMKINTFLQNVVRARTLMRDCLRAAGIAVEEYLR